MSKTLAINNRMICAVLKDAYGNGISGNTERSLRFLRVALQLVAAQQEVIEDKNDARKQVAFDGLSREAVEQDGWPQFDGSKLHETMTHWASKGLT